MLETIQRHLQTFWQNTLLFNAVMFTVAAVLSFWMYQAAFDDQFRCAYLIVDQVDAPVFMCEGADLGGATGVTGAVDSVANALGLGNDDESVVGDALTVPGLAALIDGPLGVIRKISIVATLVLVAGISVFATWVVRHLQFVARLIRGDRQAWQQVGASARIFILFFVAMLLPIWFLAL
jgi:hypothetical protein